MLQVRSDRRDHRPFGLYGGSPGAPSENYLNPDGENRLLPSQAHHDDQARRRVPPCARRRRRLGRSAGARSRGRAARRAQRVAVAGEGARPTTASSSTSRAGRSMRPRPRSAATRSAPARGWRERARRSSGTIRCRSRAPRNSRHGHHLSRRRRHRRHLHRHRAARLRRHASTPRRSPRASTTTPARSSRASREVFGETGLTRRRDRGDPPRHHGRLQRHPGAQGRARRPDHHQGLPRRAGDPHAAHAAPLRHRLDEAARRWSSAICARSVDERIDHRGQVERALDPADAERAVDALLAEKVEAIAVCLLNSFANPAHELMLKEIVAAQGAATCRSASPSRCCPRSRNTSAPRPRSSTPTSCRSSRPTCARCATGSTRPASRRRLLLMQSNGGLTTDAAAAERPMNIIESGPAGGVVGAQALARAKGLDKIITFDMGGTTAKASMVEDGEVTRAQEYAVGAGIMIGSRLLTGRRLHAEGAGDRPRRGRRRRRLACLDRRRRRAAGRAGERRRLARAGLLRHGRRDADRSPTPTSLLGYINPRHLVGGALKLNADKARAAFAETDRGAARA